MLRSFKVCPLGRVTPLTIFNGYHRNLTEHDVAIYMIPISHNWVNYGDLNIFHEKCFVSVVTLCVYYLDSELQRAAIKLTLFMGMFLFQAVK